MKQVFFLLLFFFPSLLFAQKDTLRVFTDAPSIETSEEEPERPLTWRDRREPFLAGLMSYLLPGAGQVYNKDYEKAVGILAVMGYSIYQSTQSVKSSSPYSSTVCSLGIAGAYLYSMIDAVVTAKKINKAIQLQMSKKTSLTLKPDFQMQQTSFSTNPLRLEPTVGLRLKFSL